MTRTLSGTNKAIVLLLIGLVALGSYLNQKTQARSVAACEERLKALSYKIESAAMPSNGIYPPTISEVRTILYGKAINKEFDDLVSCPLGNEYRYTVSPDGSNFTLCCTSRHWLGRGGFPQYNAESGLLRP